MAPHCHYVAHPYFCFCCIGKNPTSYIATNFWWHSSELQCTHHWKLCNRPHFCHYGIETRQQNDRYLEFFRIRNTVPRRDSSRWKEQDLYPLCYLLDQRRDATHYFQHAAQLLTLPFSPLLCGGMGPTPFSPFLHLPRKLFYRIGSALPGSAVPIWVRFP